jgi:hypothetical protein
LPVSTSKYKELLVVCHEVEVGQEELSGAFSAEEFTLSQVEQPNELVQLILGILAEIFAFKAILSDKSIGILVGAALPEGVGIGEVDPDAGLGSEFFMLGHFLAAVVDDLQAIMRLDAVEYAAEACQYGIGRAAVDLGQHREERGALHQGADRRAIVFSLDGVALPVAGDEPLFDLGRALVDGCRVGYLIALVVVARADGVSGGRGATGPGPRCAVRRAAWRKAPNKWLRG